MALKGQLRTEPQFCPFLEQLLRGPRLFAAEASEALEKKRVRGSQAKDPTKNLEAWVSWHSMQLAVGSLWLSFMSASHRVPLLRCSGSFGHFR